MAWSSDSLSTVPDPDDWIPPDDVRPVLNEDREKGPIALNDPSEGLMYQDWHLTWDALTGDFVLTPALTGGPVTSVNAANVTQCSLCFDQAGHENIAWTDDQNQCFLYWYVSLAAGWVTTTLPPGVTTPTLTLDDKRSTQTQSSDWMMWWTETEVVDEAEVHRLYYAKQRDRFEPLVPYLLAENVPKYIYFLGLNVGYRLQVGAYNQII